MKTISILLATLLLPLFATAQNEQALVPPGYEMVNYANGDLNKDGHNDVVTIIRSLNEENIIKLDDDYSYNTNTPRLVIYFGNPDGTYKEWNHYDNLLPAVEDVVSWDYAMNITEKGALIITVTSFRSAGGWSNDTYSHTYRFQNGDFYLIGADASSMQRNTLDITEYSWNFLSGKKQIKTSKLEDESDKPAKERWNNIGRKPLKKLGSIDMFEYYVD